MQDIVDIIGNTYPNRTFKKEDISYNQFSIILLPSQNDKYFTPAPQPLY